MSNKIKLLLLVLGLATNPVLNSSAFADENVLREKDAYASVKLESSKHSTGTLPQNQNTELSSDNNKPVKDFNNSLVPLDRELLILRPEYFSFSQKNSENYKFSFPANILNFSSGVYIGSPLFTRNKQAIFKGASEEDLDTTIGAALKLVILNR